MSTIMVNLRYLVIPDFVYSDNRLTALELKLYAFINTFKGDAFFFGNDHLSKMFDVHEVSVSRALNKLKDYGYVDFDYKIKAGGGTMRYVKNLKGDTPKQDGKVGLNNEANSDLTVRFSQTKHIGLSNDNNMNDNNEMSLLDKSNKDIYKADQEKKQKQDAGEQSIPKGVVLNTPVLQPAAIGPMVYGRPPEQNTLMRSKNTAKDVFLTPRRYKKPASEVMAVKALFEQKFFRKHKVAYKFNKTQDMRLLKSLCKVYNITQLEKYMTYFFVSEDKFIKQAGHTIGIFHSQINKLISTKGGIYASF